MKKPYEFHVTLPVQATAPCAFGSGDADQDDSEQDDNKNDDDADADNDDDDTPDPQSPEALAAAADAKAIERQARAQGWRPEAEFKGEGKWVDAETFLDRGAKFNKTLLKKVEKLEADVAKSRETNAQFAQFHKDAMARKDKELDAAIKQAKLQRSEAIRNGEDDEAVALDDRIDTLKEEKAKLKEEPAKKEPEKAAPSDDDEDPDATNPVLRAWVSDGNEWFDSDARLRGYAIAISEQLRKEGDTSVGVKFLNKVKAQLEEDFPAKFAKGNPLRKRAGSMEAGGGAAPDTGGHTEADLPKVDRELMRKFVSDGLMTKAEFLKNYDWK